jgi:DNA polymerase I-like protein with 3'-5' exonuclease and polymerase domains
MSKETAGNWQSPRELPDLRRVGIVAIDTEENDEGLRAGRGSGWPWHGGWICGISVAWREGGALRTVYIPMCHPDSVNFDPAQVFHWLNDLIAAGVRFVTMNGGFDWAWLGVDLGVAMPSSNQLEEVAALAALIDENQLKYSLDALCGRYGLPGKDTALLNQAVEAAGFVSGRKKINASEHIWRLPARYVGPYAEADAINTLMLFETLTPIIEREGTRSAYRLECDLLPMVLEMRRKGIRVNQDAAEQARNLMFASATPHSQSSRS